MPIPVKLNITPAQLKKLQEGGSIQVKHTAIGAGNILNLNEDNVKKLVKALKSSKATRISMDDDELEGSGFGKKFKKKFTQVKKTVKKAKVGKHVAKSLNKVDKALQVITPIVGAVAPQFVPALMAAQEGVQAGKQVTQSVRNISRDVDMATSKGGMKRLAKAKLEEVMASNPDVANVVNGVRDIRNSVRVAQAPVKAGGSVKVYNDQNNFVRPNQSGYDPVLPSVVPKTKKGGKLTTCNCPNCDGGCGKRGGSFASGKRGGSFRGGSFTMN